MAHGNRDGELVLSKEEAELAEQIAQLKNISIEEASSLVIHGEIKRRVRNRTGRGPAKVYPMKGR